MSTARWMAVAGWALVGMAAGACPADGGEGGDGPAEGASKGASDRAVRIDPAAVERNDIRVATVETAVLAEGVKVPAEVQLPPDRVAHVTPIVSGQLGEVKVSIGDRVEAGDVLAVLESVALGETRSAFERAQADVEVARSTFERQKELQEEGIGARRALLEAKAELARAEAELSSVRRRLSVYGRGGGGSSTVVRAPIEGVVLERKATVGEMVDPTHRLFVVGDPRRVWVIGRVYPQDVGQVRQGAAATLHLPAVAGRTWRGTLDYVAPALEEGSRTMPVRLVLDNDDGTLRPGLFGTLSIAAADASTEPVPVIETDAAIDLDGRPTVFVPREPAGAFLAVPVVLGARDEDRVEVREGLAPGDRYVVEGAFVLKSELAQGGLSEGHQH
ncbi:MAG: efflux RND transporter periplasmic adaptor subunit [Myxococcota bacterium]